MRELSAGDALYKKGDESNYFYFLLRGEAHQVVESAQQTFANKIEEN